MPNINGISKLIKEESKKSD